jgi:hypothetical protein
VVALALDVSGVSYPEVYLAALQDHDFLRDAGTSIGAHMTYLTLVVRTDGNSADFASYRERPAADTTHGQDVVLRPAERPSHIGGHLESSCTALS